MNCIWILLLLCCCNGTNSGKMHCDNMCDNECAGNRRKCEEKVRGNCTKHIHCKDDCGCKDDGCNEKNCDHNECGSNVMNCDCNECRNNDNSCDCNECRTNENACGCKDRDKDCDYQDRREFEEWKRKRNNSREECDCDNNASNRVERIVPPDFHTFGRSDNYDHRNATKCETCGCES